MTDNAAPANSIDDYPHKVFAGNLSFKTTEEELKTFFEEAGKVVKVNIITRGTRSLGYGFVAYESEDACKAAVEKLHKKELGGREINIEVAKPKAELEAAKKERAAKKKAQPRKQNGRFFNRRRGTKKDGADNKEGEDDKEAEGEKKEGASTDKKSPKKKPRKPKTVKKPKKTDKPRREPTGTPSKTTCFVANLPFSLDDEKFAAVFQGYKIKSAKVVVRRGTGRSKGFGFVELEDEEEQQRLLAAGPFESEGRELNIKIALSEEKAAADGEAAAAAAEPEAQA